VLIAVCFTAVAQLVTWGRLDEPSNFHGSRWLNAVLSAGVTGALAWRRRAPLVMVCWAVAVFCLSEVLVRHDVSALSSFVPLIVLTASAGYHCSRRDSLVAAGVATVGMTTVVLVDPELRSVANIGYDLVFLLGPWLAMRGLRERENRAAALGADLERERATQAAARREVVATERVRIAQELHDVVAHSVSVMVVQAGGARRIIDRDPERAAHAAAQIEYAGRAALVEMRRLLGLLHAGEGEAGALAPQPSLAELDGLVERSRAAGLPVEVRVLGERRPLPAGIDLAAYRIVQEALTNTLKHAGAAPTEVHLRWGEDELELEILDRGGAGTSRNGSGGGHGLLGMAERVRLYGGELETGPLPEGGWTVRATLPCAGREAVAL
jgi:signal transduction histidine kinase